MEFAEILEQTIALLQHLAHDENGRILVWAGQSAPHATPLVDRGLATEARDLTERGLADAIIISGDYTGAPTSPEDIAIVRQHTILPILIGSGATGQSTARIRASRWADCRELLQEGRQGRKPGGGSPCQKVY